MSPSLRREWIEILCCQGSLRLASPSPSLRREWIEITGYAAESPKCQGVSLLAEGVD